MLKRLILASLFGGLAMFLWSFISHEILNLGEGGVQEVPNESQVLAALQSSIGPNTGIYLYPGMGLGPNPTMQQRNAAMPEYARRFLTEPSGMLIYHPPGRRMEMLPMLTTELATEMVEALLAVVLLMQTRLNRFISRVAFVTILGALATITTNISYWNWYGFPAGYTVAFMSSQILGFLCGGMIIALVLGRTSMKQS